MSKFYKKLSVEIADTDQKRSMGLMFRKKLGENEGMLFKFPRHERLSFWMQNTYIPLDIAFLDNDGKIMQISEMSPLCTKMVSSEQKCQMALEVNKGWFKQNGISIGDKIGNIDNVLKKISSIRLAQAVKPEDQIDLNTPSAEEDHIEPPQTQPPQEEQKEEQKDPQQQEALNDPKVKVNRSVRDIIEYADKHDLPLMIVYRTMKGNIIGPRKFLPIAHRYRIKTGPSGEHLEAYDASANINLGEMEIEGGTIKTPLIQNIISIQPVEDPNKPQGQMPNMQGMLKT